MSPTFRRSVSLHRERTSCIRRFSLPKTCRLSLGTCWTGPAIQSGGPRPDRVRVGAVGRQEQRAGADVPDRLARLLDLALPRLSVTATSPGLSGGAGGASQICWSRVAPLADRRRAAKGCLRTPVRLTMASAGHQVPGEVQERSRRARGGRDVSRQMGRAPCHRMPYRKQRPGQIPHDRTLNVHPRP